MNHLLLKDFPLIATDKIRYSDTDRQGHVNNAVFATFLETARVEFLLTGDHNILENDASFVIAGLHLNFIAEITWPGSVSIGTGILKIGNSSITLYQQIYQEEICVATAETVIVQVKNGQGLPLSSQAKNTLNQWMLPKTD
ncbi:acyl-CoA thioesterase [Robertkochia marina]|uniref:Acyl-CoA thioesterase n=1 Tax=Robertkochia marina TaxID=1227945 RepID=A0A4S3M1U5_9FLAO|nr:thioesterase family protein [Robertkochia marina]THD68983.1 acyl-CoA thioesterase [Robertkochia marina]TRZ44805.1 acyl-CoA thioesterase [Robertkochia marina]